MIVMFVFNIVSPNDSQPKKGNTHNSKKRNKIINFLSISRFKSKTIRLLRFKDTFNRAKSIRIITNSTRSIVISNKKPRVRSIRIIRNNNISLK